MGEIWLWWENERTADAGKLWNVNQNKGGTHAKLDVLAKCIDQLPSQIYFTRKVLTKCAFSQVFRNKKSAYMFFSLKKNTTSLIQFGKVHLN